MHSEIKISSNIKNICQVEYFLNNIFNEFKFSRKIYCKMYLSVTESVINSIVHGNKSNPSKFVYIHFINYTDYFEYRVEDQGIGFDFNNIPDPLKKKNILNESGRGIFIMKHYADKVIYENKGAKVKLIFNKK